MLCESCHTKEATVHIASVMYAAANVDARHFCGTCALAVTTANPVLSVTARNLPPVHLKPVTAVATPALANIQSIEKKLAELDPIWEAFCARHRFQFIPGRELWPNRMAWGHGKMDYKLVLTMDVKFTEVLERGFYPEMPWSLYAMASLTCSKRSQAPAVTPRAHQPVITFELFRRLPFSELAKVLEAELERAFSMLSETTREDIERKGEAPQGRPPPFRLFPF